MEKPYYVHAVWDEEARVWVASSEDLPGLPTESETAEALVEKLKSLIPSFWRSMGAPVLSRLRSNFSRDASSSRRDAEFYAGTDATAACRRLPFRASRKGRSRNLAQPGHPGAFRCR